VWCAALRDFHRELPRLESTLSLDEQVRASRFRSIDDRDAFVIGRGILRELLGQYIGRGASTIKFSYGPFGKPEIRGLPDQPVYFNTSRSGGLVVYAVTSAGPVGVDVERVRMVLEFEYIASRFFSPLEANRLTALPPDRQMEGFFACWTRKEAFVKATGKGIGRGTVPVDPAAQACSRAGDDSHLPDTWRFEVLRPASGYVGGLGHRAGDVRVLEMRVSDAILSDR
jgi:4'-phosphopantetheinyl transferase